jgi:hypothetical protein
MVGRLRRRLILLGVVPILVTGAVPSCSDASGPNCCRVCTTGKACGDSCIAAGNECQVGSGCACDG